MKGCNLTCPWCANPENISYEFKKYEENNQKKVWGYDISLKDLKEEILKDKEYYSLNNGGVTFSGGEPLLQIKKLEPLLKELNDEKINICLETALQTPTNLLEIALRYIDEFFVDIKILDKKECENILNGNINLYKSNLKLLLNQNKNVIFRVPLNEEYTLKENNINLILELLKNYPNQKVEIFKIHNLGENKYNVLNKKIIPLKKVENKKIKSVYNKINKVVEKCEIINI